MHPGCRRGVVAYQRRKVAAAGLGRNAAVAAVALGFEERDIGFDEPLVGISDIGRQRGYAKAGGDEMARAGDLIARATCRNSRYSTASLASLFKTSALPSC